MNLDTIYTGDALSVLKTLPDSSVDAVITDPPYNITNLDFEQSIDWSLYWKEIGRLMRTANSPIVMFSQQPFTTDLIMSNRKQWRYELIWEKTMPVGYLDAKRRPLRCHENIQVFAAAGANYYPVMAEAETIRATARKREGKPSHYNNHDRTTTWVDSGQRYPRSVLTYAQRNTSFEKTHTNHPTEKPLALMNYLIELFTREGDAVLDCFCGSGSTLVSASNYGRRFIGIEIDAEYVKIANQRLSNVDPYHNRHFPDGSVQYSLWEDQFR